MIEIEHSDVTVTEFIEPASPAESVGILDYDKDLAKDEDSI